MVAPKRKTGAPLLCNRVVRSGIVSMFRDGHSKAEICKRMGIEPITINEWIDSDQHFSAAINQAMDEFLKHGAETSLKDLVLGYTKTEVVSVVSKRDPITGQMVKGREEVITTKHPPDYKAIRFTLHNRFRNKWNKPSITSIDLSGMSKEQLVELSEMCLEMKNGKEDKDES